MPCRDCAGPRYPDGGGSWFLKGGGCAHSPRLASVWAGQAARACVLRPGLAVAHRAARNIASSTPRCRATRGATANGACARTPEPPAQRQRGSAKEFGASHCACASAATCRTAVAPVGAGPIRGRTGGDGAHVVLTRRRMQSSVVAREAGPENTGAAPTRPPRPTHAAPHPQTHRRQKVNA